MKSQTFFLILTVLSPVSIAAEEKQPNILLIFADDQAYNTVGALGNSEIRTPNLDSLVRRGVTFTHCYNQGGWGGAICVASRTMLNTGRFLWKAHQVYDTTEAERQAGRFWSEYLKGAGYETYMTGKWHVKANAQKAFQLASHVRGGMPQQTEAGYNRPIAGQTDPWKPWKTRFGGFWEGGKHWSEVVGDDAEQFLQRAAGRDEPFFMYLAFNAPHDPRQSPKQFVDSYPLDKVSLPKSFVPEYPWKDAIGCGEGLRDEKLAPFPRTPYAVQVHRQEYYAIITHMDAQIGRILDALQASGKADNTYIIFTADHGLAVGHHGLLGKQNLFDHSVRVPLMVVGPNIPKDRRIDAAVYLQDIMPTTLDLAGVEKPEHVQFSSLLPLIEERRRQSYDAIYGAYRNLQRMVTQDNYKLILYPEIQKLLLFDLDQDPEEMQDLSGEKKHGSVVKRLFKRLLALQEETGDTLDLQTIYASSIADL